MPEGYFTIETVKYWGGPWDGKVAPLNDVPKPFQLADIDTHLYRCCDGRTPEGLIMYRWVER